MLNIEFREKLNDDIYGMIDAEFGKFAEKNGVVCGYKAFAFTAEEDSKVVGVLRGHSYYNDAHISDLIILEQYRGRGIGTRLLKAAEKYCADKGFESITLSTYGFQTPEFYKKHGFEVEFVRENRENIKLTKYFLIKYI